MSTIELVKPAPGESGFDRGERIIMVDGTRWGRTHVRHHGCHGTSHHFEQDEGNMLTRKPDDQEHWKEYNWVDIRSMKKRWSNREEWRSTEELVLAKARELVEAGRLRDPKIVKAEGEEAAERWLAKRAEKTRQKAANFRERAIKALGLNHDNGSYMIDDVVAAMNWAAEQ